MIRTLLVFGLLLVFSTPSSAQVWATAVSKHESNGTVIVYRYLKELHKDFVRAKQAERIMIVWRYQGNKGMPSEDERLRMDELEDELAPLQEQGFSTLALVSTGNNLRSWTFYAQTEEAFLGRLNVALRSKPAYPIEIHTSPDPAWTAYEKFARGVKQ